MHTHPMLTFLDRIDSNNIYVFSDIVVMDPLTHKTYAIPRSYRLAMPTYPTDEELEERIQDWIEHCIFIPEALRLPVVGFNCTKEEACEPCNC